ncbi:hypothetical protein P7K49_027296 [Saguinus oedipus]|uniref:Uncharacterized protein n=1 Tax=Saguinus oedipus TaxID=9490 RepID=A0ABQ9U931_SAGOE|nr:hypothetical protein P7K49_027296 [Saguinus oedipus]
MGKRKSFSSRFHRRPRQQRQPQWFPLLPSDFSAGRVHPAAPARVPHPGSRYPARCLSHHRGLQPGFTSSRNLAPTSSALRRALPPPVWRPLSRNKVVPPSASSFVRRSPVRPPLLQVPAPMEVTAEEPEEPMEVIAEEELEEPMEESMDDEVETQGQEEEKGGAHSNDGRAATSRPLETQGNLASLNCSPRALKGSVQSEAHGVPSAHSPARGVLPFGKPDPAPAVLPGPVPGCSHWPEKAASQVLEKGQLPGSSGLQIRGKETQHKDPAAPVVSSSPPPRAASHGSQQAKASGQPQQLPPVPPEQWRWGRDEGPSPAKRPRLSLEGFTNNMGAVGSNAWLRRLKKRSARIKNIW